MPYGLLVRNASGAVTVDHADRLARYHSHGTFTLSSNSVTIPVVGMVNDDSWVVNVSDIAFPFQYGSAAPTFDVTKNTGSVTFSGSTISTADYYILRT